MSFENFIYEYDFVFDQINRNLRTSKKSAIVVSSLLLQIIAELEEGKTIEQILENIKSSYNVLIEQPKEDLGIQENSKLKSETFISSALPNAIKCSICGGLIHTNSISMDHIIRKREGGDNNATNVQITHPYCNTGYKS